MKRCTLAALAVLFLLGCGTTDRPPPQPRLTRAVSEPLWEAIDEPQRLQTLAIAAINAHRVPPALQEELLSRVNAYAARPQRSTKLRVQAWLRNHAPPRRAGAVSEP